VTQRISVVILLVGLAVLTGSQPARGQTTITVPSAAGQVTVVADRIEQFGTDNLVVATGNVEITRGNARLIADRAEVNRETGDVAAVGRVIFYDGDDRLAGDRIDYNYRTGTGVVNNGRSRTAPYYRLSGERMERLGEGIYGIRRGVFTTCEDDPPTWSFHAADATADLNDAVHGTHASFWVKDVPVIPWLPGFYAAIRRERQTGFLFPVAGYSGFKGFFAEIPFFWAISDSQDALISLGYMTERGPAGNVTYRYVISPDNRGSLTGFLVYESQVDQDLRGYGSFKHGWDITKQLTLTADVNRVSNNSFLRDYAVPLQSRGTQFVPSNVFLSQRWPTFNLTGNVFWYQDLTQRSPVALQRLPQIFFNGAPQPVPGLPGFLYQFDTSAVNFVRDVGSQGGRLAVQPLVSRPTRIADVITVTPFAGGIITGYTKTVTGLSPGPGQGIVIEDTNNDALLRGLAVLGGDIEARASRIYQAGFMGIDALLHVVEPRLNYTFVGGGGLEGVPQWTELDRIDNANRVTYSLINRVFGKTSAPEGTEAVKLEVLRFTLAQSYDLMRTEQPFSSLFGELIVNPSSFLYLRGDATYDFYGGGFQSLTTQLGLVLSPERAASLGLSAASIGSAAAAIATTYDKNANVNFVQGVATADITRFLTARFQTNWSVKSGAFVENRYGLEIKFQCWAVALEYITRFRSSDEFRFTVNLLGVGGIGSGFGLGTTSGSGSGLF
jgi:LPS-assembly protein